MNLTSEFLPGPKTLGTTSTTPPDEARKRAQIAESAKSFESSFLSSMMQSMFAGVDAGEFGGGEGEKAFKSILVDSFAKQTVKAGGIGISAQIGREMLKMQGLTEEKTS